MNEPEDVYKKVTGVSRSRVASGVGALLVALGLAFLAQQLLGFSWGGAWPLFIIAVGLLLFVGVVVGGRAAGPLAIPGAVITVVGLILQYQSTFHLYRSWAYVWTLLIVATGAGLLIDAWWRDQPERARLAGAVVGVGGALFAVGFAFFEIALNLSGLADGLPVGLGGRTIGMLGALALIALGAYLLIRRSRHRSVQAGSATGGKQAD